MTTLSLTPYTPNLDDPRIHRRLKSVLTWCDCLRGQKRPKSINSAILRKVFGNTSQPFGRWLRSNLLMQVGSYQAGKHSYSYFLNESGYEKLCALVGVEVSSAPDAAAELYGPIIRAEIAPEYSDSGTRRYHPVQNLRREDRKISFAGWWDYDIDACAPTLLFQYVAQGRGEGWGEKWLPTIRRLVYEKDAMRHYVQLLTGLESKVVKKLINALFFKAILSPHHASTLFQTLNCSVELLLRLKMDPIIKSLRREVKYMWQLAQNKYSAELTRILIQTGRVPNVVKNKAKLRSAIYRMLERQVIDAMEAALPCLEAGCVLMHDGFMLHKRVDIRLLETAVLDRTGYRIKLKETCFAPGIADDAPGSLEEAIDKQEDKEVTAL